MTRRFSNIEDERLVRQIKKFPSLFDPENKDYKNYFLKETIWQEIAKSLNKNDEECKKRWKDIRDNYFKYQRRQKVLKRPRMFPRRSKWGLLDLLGFLDIVKQKRSSCRSPSENVNNNNDGPSEMSTNLINIDDNSKKRNLELSNITEIIKEEYDSGSEELHNYSSSIIAAAVSSSSAGRIEEFCSPTTTEMTRNFKNDNKILFNKSLDDGKEINDIQIEDDLDIFMKSITLSLKRFPSHLAAIAKINILQMITHLQFSHFKNVNNDNNNASDVVLFKCVHCSNSI